MQMDQIARKMMDRILQSMRTSEVYVSHHKQYFNTTGQLFGHNLHPTDPDRKINLELLLRNDLQTIPYKDIPISMQQMAEHYRPQVWNKLFFYYPALTFQDMVQYILPYIQIECVTLYKFNNVRPERRATLATNIFNACPISRVPLFNTVWIDGKTFKRGALGPRSFIITIKSPNENLQCGLYVVQIRAKHTLKRLNRRNQQLAIETK
jgi:hypothetical protein